MIKKCLLVLASILFITSCTVTETRQLTPNYRTTVNDSLQTELHKLITCEQINVNGKASVANNVTTTTLEIEVVNGQNIPTGFGNIDQKKLAKAIAEKFKYALQDPNQFDAYSVLFVDKKEKFGASVRTREGITLNNNEL